MKKIFINEKFCIKKKISIEEFLKIFHLFRSPIEKKERTMLLYEIFVRISFSECNFYGRKKKKRKEKRSCAKKTFETFDVVKNLRRRETFEMFSF